MSLAASARTCSLKFPRALFFLFSFDRLIATFVSYCLRVYVHHKYKIYVRVTSLQISLLAGRLFLKGVHYQDADQAVLVNEVCFTWRYWLSKVQEPEIFRSGSASVTQREDGNNNAPRDKSKFDVDTADSCRFHLRVSGVEFMLYNNEKAIDAIETGDPPVAPLEALRPHDKDDTPRSALRIRARRILDILWSYFPLAREDVASKDQKASLPSFLSCLPLRIECSRVAAVIGNSQTPCVMVLKADTARGRVDAASAASHLDIYKLLSVFAISGLIVKFRDVDADNAQSREWKTSNMPVDDSQSIRRGHNGVTARIRALTMMGVHQLRSLSRWQSSRNLPERIAERMTPDQAHSRRRHDRHDQFNRQSEWLGIARYLDDDSIDLPTPHTDEYARFDDIVHCSDVGMRIFWDVPGSIPSATYAQAAPPDPEFAIELCLSGAKINYGAWADRQRCIIQDVLLPPMRQSSKYVAPQVGDNRTYDRLKIHVYVEDIIHLRIPTKEASKDYKWHGKSEDYDTAAMSDLNPGPRRRKGATRNKKSKRDSTQDRRPAGWLSLKVEPGSIVQYGMGWTASQNKGFLNTLDVSITGLEMTSSVNAELLMNASDLSVKADLSQPLTWNTLRSWQFTIASQSMSMFLLRDHMFLLTDLIGDFTSGPPTAQDAFVPYRYDLDFDLHHSTLYLNTNTADVIQHPTKFDSNNFVELAISNLLGKLQIDMSAYRPLSSTLLFEACGDALSADLHTPIGSTFHHSLRDKRIASLPKLKLIGTYKYYTEQSADLIDVLDMSLTACNGYLMLSGIAAKHLVNIKENYFGDFVHFTATDDTHDVASVLAASKTDQIKRYNYRQSNGLDVMLGITVDVIDIAMPATLYTTAKRINLNVPSAVVDLRVTNFFLDLQIDIPLCVIGFASLGTAIDRTGRNTVTVDGIDVYGHCLFGLPPAEPIYFSTWNIKAGLLHGAVVPKAVQCTMQVAAAFIFTFADVENSAPKSQVVKPRDLTFVIVRLEGIQLSCISADHDMTLRLDRSTVKFNDAATEECTSRVHADLSGIRVECVPRPTSIARGFVEKNDCAAILLIESDVMISLTSLEDSTPAVHILQQGYLSRHDAPTNRLRLHNGDGATYKTMIASSLPSVPQVLSRADKDILTYLKTVRPSSSGTSIEESGSGDIHTSIIVSSSPTTRIVCALPVLEVVAAFNDLTEALTSEEVLDAIQIEAIESFADGNRRSDGTIERLDCAVQIPNLAIEVPLSSRMPSALQEYAVFHLEIEQGLLCVRKSMDTSGEHASPFSIHCTVASVASSLIAKGFMHEQSVRQTLMTLDIRETLAWHTHLPISNTSVSVEDISSNVDPKHLEKFNVIIQNSAEIVIPFTSRYAQHARNQGARHIRLMYLIKKERQQDKMVHTARMPQLQRIYPHHVRNHESWRMLSRLRGAFESIEANAEITCDSTNPQAQDDGEPEVGEADMSSILQDWQLWCTWDVPAVETTRLYRQLFGSVQRSSHLDQPPSSNLNLHLGNFFVSAQTYDAPCSSVRVVNVGIQYSICAAANSRNILADRDPHVMKVLQVTVQSLKTEVQTSILRLYSELDRLISDFQLDLSTTEKYDDNKRPSHELQCLLYLGDLQLTVRFSQPTLCLSISETCVSYCTTQHDKTLPQSSVGAVSIEDIVVDVEVATQQVLSLAAGGIKTAICHASTFKSPLTHVRVSSDVDTLSLTTGSNVKKILNIMDDFIEHDLPMFTTSAKQVTAKSVVHGNPVRNDVRDKLICDVVATVYSSHIAILLTSDLQYRVDSQTFRAQLHMSADGSLLLHTHLDPTRHGMTCRIKTPHPMTTLWTPHLSLEARMNEILVTGSRMLKLSVVIGHMTVSAEDLRAALVLMQTQHLLDDWLVDTRATVEGIRRKFSSAKPIKDEMHMPKTAVRSSSKTSIALVSKGLAVQERTGQEARRFTTAHLALGFSAMELSFDGDRIDLSLEHIYCDIDSTGASSKSTHHAHVYADVRMRYDVRDEISAGELRLLLQCQQLDILIFSDLTPKLIDIISQTDQHLTQLRLMDRVQGLQKEDTLPVSKQTDRRLPAMTILLDKSRIKYTVRPSGGSSGEMTKMFSDAELTFKKIMLASRHDMSASLKISSTEFRLESRRPDAEFYSINTALMSEVVFKAHRATSGRIGLRARGDMLRLNICPDVFEPINNIRYSINEDLIAFRRAATTWRLHAIQRRHTATSPADYLKAMHLHANFAGATVTLVDNAASNDGDVSDVSPTPSTTLRSPGIISDIRYKRTQNGSGKVEAQVKVLASSNSIEPSTLQRLLQLVDNVKSTIQRHATSPEGDIEAKQNDQLRESNVPNNASDTRRIWQKIDSTFVLCLEGQEFDLSCRPYAHIFVKAKLEELQMTVTATNSDDGVRKHYLMARTQGFTASLQHAYSREPTLSATIASTTLIVMDNKIGDSNGPGQMLVALLISPIQSSVNIRQIQDLLVFRDVWTPQRAQMDAASAVDDSDATQFVERYRQISTAAAFPWVLLMRVEAVTVAVDLGQSIGRNNVAMDNLWLRSTKSVDWRQSLCMGLSRVEVSCNGRVGGQASLEDTRIMTTIAWQVGEKEQQTPLISVSLSVSRVFAKASFDYQSFAFTDVSDLTFIMYNVRDTQAPGTDRLVARINAVTADVFCLATSSAQALSLYQTYARLVQEKATAYDQARDELKMPTSARSIRATTPHVDGDRKPRRVSGAAISLRSHVIADIGRLRFGCFPSSFSDSQILKIEAATIHASVLIGVMRAQIQSNLRLRLGRLVVSFTDSIPKPSKKSGPDTTMEYLIRNAMATSGGTILSIPEVIAHMQTYQITDKLEVDFIFKSTFGGQVDVSWNYARVASIRSLWALHQKTLANRLGKTLPQSAISITAPLSADDCPSSQGQASKITAIVNVPISKYQYRALRPAIIETPQLRDMGQATPPLEWIGLDRERIPGVVHQLVIVALLKVAKEAEGAYARILGNSVDTREASNG